MKIVDENAIGYHRVKLLSVSIMVNGNFLGELR